MRAFSVAGIALTCSGGLIACTPEPLGFSAADAAADDSPGADSAQTDSASEQDAVADALPPPTVYLLVRPTVIDPTVEQLRSELEGFGIAYSELSPSGVSAVEPSRSVFVAGFSSKSADWAPAAPALMDAVSAGSWILLEAFALYLLDDGGVEGVVTTGWVPACNNHFYFVAPVVAGSSPFFANVPTWDPPEAPDKPTQSLAQVIAAGTNLQHAALKGDATAFWTTHSFWELIAESCAGSTTSSYCVAWGGCTPTRWVHENGIAVRAIGKGRATWLYQVPVVPGLYAWGPVAGLLHRNFIQWAIAEISKT